MCNGAAVCRKLKAGTMCPSFMATKDENDSTRGRANALRNALAGNVLTPADFADKKTYETLDLCLSCKACKTECPSSVDMAKIKTEFLAQYHEKHGTPLRARMMGHIHTISRIASPVAPLANLAAAHPRWPGPGMRDDGSRIASASSRPSSRNTFVRRWHQYRKHTPVPNATRGKVVYFHDTFATYNYPRIGLAAVKLLEAAGYRGDRRGAARLLRSADALQGPGRRRPQVGPAERAACWRPTRSRAFPIIGTEPSCILTLRDEYRDLLPDDPDVGDLAAATRS